MRPGPARPSLSARLCAGPELGRTGMEPREAHRVARTPLRKGERLRYKIEAQLAKVKTYRGWLSLSSRRRVSPILPTAE
jgi:hypothetical protein